MYVLACFFFICKFLWSTSVLLSTRSLNYIWSRHSLVHQKVGSEICCSSMRRNYSSSEQIAPTRTWPMVLLKMHACNFFEFVCLLWLVKKEKIKKKRQKKLPFSKEVFQFLSIERWEDCIWFITPDHQSSFVVWQWQYVVRPMKKLVPELKRGSFTRVQMILTLL